ncbi:MAG: LemA family protein [Candidatus Amesbacteria bacterium GW2011_GWB1_47_26]|uniref:LemA family protein n=1 Tax=Candidatus Amesbacteria bacterium GW2011_GWC2_45_19 TaxID=1618366 RepID=A0A0G1M4Y8_9BACT|nr:MAG: LemA family protein [Candidatus Amesbacteria bacterium GW2011_GWC2_45_19]KKU36803.1 MAG: LemA family protein [Candidatus Amesbacteria bacterium GW2011_GWA1_46_35]KKU68943.1 MAG: LemA family protein [Microgenomates group bacterium GW2011_GWC1_47_20]KKU74374.1 MAG: LemA family protein [Candidatus Amesbacteria bacterium GW2011_GWB1_47_26]KKU78779.1 MAG: LemA family protein [Candidatus Amesbacteria bacterium GW2011_GWA2_47_70]
MSYQIIFFAIAAGLVLYVVGVYNGLVSLRTRIKAAVQEIGNQLKRQFELIPNLEASVKGYLAHEKSILEMLADARKMVAKGQDASAKVAELLPKLQIVVESNPQLKGSDVVGKLMEELRDTSDKIMYSRRTMIDLSADYNIRLVTFPSSVIANAFGFKPEKGLEVPESELQTPQVSI